MTGDTVYSETNPTVLSADSAGELALQRFKFSTRWRVQAVYRNCFYCQEEEGEIICIGTDRIDRGPFTVRGSAFRSILDSGLSVGTVIESNHGSLYFGDISSCIDVSRAEVWDATLPVNPEPLTSLEEDNGLLILLARQSAPAESLGQLIAGIFSGGSHSSTKTPFLAQLLHERVQGAMKRIRSEGDVRSLAAITAVLTSHLTGLIGAGYGLTPSGDDFCSGVILGIARMHNHFVAKSLARALSFEAVGRTTTLSLAFFRSLAGSRVSETQDSLLKHFGHSGTADLRRILLETASHGSTSGWDMLAGFAFGVELFRKRCTAGNLDYEQGCVC